MTETSPQNGELTRHLTFKDVFFLSFGGMSPLLSILTYAAFAITLAGYDAPIVMVIGTLLVLVNGLVVTQLSKRFSSSGGYYTYAFQALSARIGFDTGWMYIFYSILYALAYLTGAIFIIVSVFGISEYYAFLLIIIPSITFLIVGIKLSAKYALYAVAIEISLMVAIVVISFIITKGAAYIPNPAVYHISGGDFVLGILFAMGIPTGYGSIAPVSGEVSNPKKVVGRSVISVILIGGTLATLMIYAFANLILQNNIVIPTSDKLPVIGIILHNFGKYGIYLYYATGIATINDAILALLSFGSAASRTFFRMGYDKSFPSIFAKKVKDNPIVASLAVSAIMVALPLLIMHYITVETAFIFLGTISALGGLFIHVSANFSLIRIGLRRGRRLISRTKKGIYSYINGFKEVILALVGAIISSIVLVYSAYSTVSWYTLLFLVWIVVGFILSEVKAITLKTSDDMMDISKEGRILAENLMNIKVMDARIPGLDVIVGINDPLRSALEKLLSKNIPYAIVLDENMKPVGTLYVIDILLLPKDAIDRGKVNQMHLEKVVNISVNDEVTDAVRILKENNVNILSIVDGAGKCTGTITEREILLKLASTDKPAVE
ncbi:amino acid permease [Ferroplasma acidiphilum]|jgi:amino acid transporter|uniref:amino acid permease n=1 Tax=Ferroplasma acidiphilum TaxID=74969 RepID=UPI0023F331C4|nr:amino acid permease [Ferroplasma acidiphilum]MCL4348715.1 amino acid permease [Candidatus Thermoplasmatota archaeon]